MAIKNISTNEKTVKAMYQLLDSDNFIVDQALLYCKYDKKGNLIPYSFVLDSYRDYFEQYLIDMDVPEKFFYQPAAFAENYYGTADLDWLVLYFSKITTLFDFKKPVIKVLPVSRLPEINRLLIEKKKKRSFGIL